MRLSHFVLLLAAVSAVCLVCAGTLCGQQPRQQPGQGEEVVRVSTELVQTDLMVFGKDGAFVDGLKREQFELRINGKPREISFFQRVAAGSRNEEAQLAAARGVPGGSPDGRPVPLDRGRAIFFFLDDIHMSAAGMVQARALLTRFVDREMGQNDEVVIASAAGQVGFLQQLTNNKTVLHAAIERLKPRPYSVLDNERPPMSEYQAELIERNDRDVTTYFVDYLLREYQNLPMDVAASMVRGRATQILTQSRHLTTTSLASLSNLARSSAQLPGRKLIFLLSDGFYLSMGNSDAADRVHSITAAAARAGVVIYAIDTRGLIASNADPSRPGNFDPAGRLERANLGEISASQDALNALANDTGGRALFNTNALYDAIPKALKETSIYYLVAWRPENEDERLGKIKKIELSVARRPELTVRLRKRFAQTETGPVVPPKTEDTPAKTAGAELNAAISSSHPKGSLPTSLMANFVNLQDVGSVIAMTMQAVTDASAFSIQDGKFTANVDVAGAVFDDHGKSVGGFRKRLTIKAISPDVKLGSANNLSYSYRLALKPGLYQVRVAAYDEKTGRAGSATEWVEVPDLSARLALSSVLAGERIGEGNVGALAGGSASTTTDGILRPNIERRFARASRLHFLIFTYNAANSATPSATPASAPANGAQPDVAVQVQVLRDDQPVITTTLRRIETEGIADLTRLPYSAEIPLQDLPSGRYLLRVIVIDRIAKTSASQQVAFRVD